MNDGNEKEGLNWLAVIKLVQIALMFLPQEAVIFRSTLCGNLGACIVIIHNNLQYLINLHVPEQYRVLKLLKISLTHKRMVKDDGKG